MSTNGSGFLSAAEILDRVDLPYEDVDVPEWGGRVRIRGLSGLEADEYSAEIAKETKRMRERLLVRCLVGQDGRPLFTEGQVDALGAKSWAALDRLAKVAIRLTGLDRGSLEEAKGESEPGPSSDSR